MFSCLQLLNSDINTVFEKKYKKMADEADSERIYKKTK